MRSHQSPIKLCPIATRGSRSGYVYVAQSPEREDTCKVGHTMRPPHVRMRELGRTTWMMPVRVHSARFFWDAITVERLIHKQLKEFALPGAEEWFCIPAWQVTHLLRETPQITPVSVAMFNEEDLSLGEQMDWAVELVESSSSEQKKAGWRDVERLSALGHGAASWLLAEHLLVSSPHEPDRALWVLDAAMVQGHASASLRRDWVASLTSSDPLRRQWKNRVNSFTERAPDPQHWSQDDLATLVQEAMLWKKRPRMAWNNAVIGSLIEYPDLQA